MPAAIDRRLTACCLFIFVCAFVHADPPKDVSHLLRPILAESGVPGMAAAVIEGDQLVATGAAGARRKGSPALVTVNDTFHLGSCTKAMTATVIATLVEERKLSWNATLAEVFPERASKMTDSWPRITLEQLLTHSSGCQRNVSDRLYRQLARERGTTRQQRESLVAHITQRPLEAQPGRQCIYSNLGVTLAGAMAERASGQSWESLMHQRLFDPLGMTSAGFGPPGDPDRNDQPRGHNEAGEVVEPGPRADNPAVIGPAGTVHANIADWAKFIAIHLEGAQGRARLLQPESYRKLHTPINDLKPQYAFGWGVMNREWAGGQVLSHTGSNTLWFCVVWIAPLKDMAVLVACNQGGAKAEKATDEAAWSLIQDHLGLK